MGQRNKKNASYGIRLRNGWQYHGKLGVTLPHGGKSRAESRESDSIQPTARCRRQRSMDEPVMGSRGDRVKPASASLGYRECRLPGEERKGNGGA